jgi:hypothetical protein
LVVGVWGLVGWVRNVVLIKCIFGSGKPRGGRDFGWEGTRARLGNRGVVYEQPKTKVDDSCHS